MKPWLVSGKLPPHVANKIAELSESGCWLWGAAMTNGYGVVHFDGRVQRAHRVVYGLLVGPVFLHLELDHLCRVRRCVNPAHMEPVTQIENNRRSESASARNARKTHCKAGHEFTPENTYVCFRADGHKERFCRTCCRERDRQRYQRRIQQGR